MAAMVFATQGMREIHAHGGHAHHSAAAFAVVGGTRHSAATGLQSREAGGSRGAATEEFFLVEEPTCFCGCGGQQAGIFLSHQPARVRTGPGTKEVRLMAFESGREMRGEHGFGGEKS